MLNRKIFPRSFAWPCGQVCPAHLPSLVWRFKTLFLVRRWGKGAKRESLFLRDKDSCSGKTPDVTDGDTLSSCLLSEWLLLSDTYCCFFSLHHQQGSTLCNRDLFWRKKHRLESLQRAPKLLLNKLPLWPHKHGTNAAPVKVTGFVLSLLNLRLLFHILIEIKELHNYIQFRLHMRDTGWASSWAGKILIV